MEARSLSPREFASVVGVSESSVKRWVDAGRIPVSRTAGGHRRIQVVDAMHFIRTHRIRLVEPEKLGLDDLAAVAAADDGAFTGSLLTEALIAGEVARVRGVILQAYLSGTPPSQLSSMTKIGKPVLRSCATISVQ